MRGSIRASGSAEMSIELAASDRAARAATAFRRRALAHRGLMAGVAIVAAIVALGLLAPLLTPYDPYHQELLQRLRPPFWSGGSWSHPLGTDNLGRDYLTRLLYGARISLLIGVAAALVSGVIGTVLGIAAGYFGGRVDLAVTFLVSVRLSMPVVLAALAVVSLIGGSLTVVIAVIGLLNWDRFAVVMRSATLQVRDLDYVTAARSVGCSNLRILASEILPNVLSHLIVVATLEMAHAILLEAALSFLGLGVRPPLPSWGLMVAEGKNHLLFEPWLVAIPGSALFLLLLAINLVGDGIRDVTAPDQRG
jgi:peptide/nickel transport system permease protein